MATLMENKITIGPELRPCIVKGKKALFHKWDISEKLLAQNTCFMKTAEEHRIMDNLYMQLKEERITVLPHYVSLHKATDNTALVEYEDGTMERVQPELVRFINTREHMDGIAWPEPEEG